MLLSIFRKVKKSADLTLIPFVLVSEGVQKSKN